MFLIYTYTAPAKKKNGLSFFSSVILTHTGPISVCISFERFVSNGPKSNSCFHHC